MRADARKRCRFAPKNDFFHAPAPESPTATSPGRRRKPKRKEKPVRVQRYYFFKKKTRRRRYVNARYFNKKTPRERHIIKSVPVPRRKYEKPSKILCQNCVASLFLLIFLTFCVVRDHEAMGSNPVTPTIKNTHALFALCVFYLPAIRDLNDVVN